MQAEPQREREWVQQLVGEWSYEVECVMGPDGDAAAEFEVLLANATSVNAGDFFL